MASAEEDAVFTCARCPAGTVTLEAGGADTDTQRAIPGSEPGQDSCTALLWRVKADLRLPVLELLPGGPYRSVLVSPKIGGHHAAARVMAEISGKNSLNPPRRDRTYPGLTQRARRNSYR